MSNFAAIKVAESFEKGKTYKLTEEMTANAPSFETKEEASKYCDLIDPDFLWVIMPLKHVKDE